MKRIIFLLAAFAAFFVSSSTFAFAANPSATLTWERNHIQYIKIADSIATNIAKLEFLGNGQTLNITPSSGPSNTEIYQIQLPVNFALGDYTIRAINNDGSTLDYANVKVVAYQSAGYNPAQDFKNTSKLIFSLFAFFTLLTPGGNRDSSFAGDETTYQGISSDEIGRDARAERKYRQGFVTSIGLDEYRNRSVIHASKYSPLASRLIADGGYLQYTLGSLVLLFPALGIALGVLSFRDISGIGHISTPSLTISILILILGALDAGAAFLTFFVFGVLAFSSHFFTSSYDLRTFLGLGAMWFTPALIANGIRTIRRSVKDVGWWERATDILLGTLLAGWAVKGQVSAIDGYAHLKLPLAEHASTCAYFAMGAILIRYLLEEHANYQNHFYLNYLSPKLDNAQNPGPKIFSWFLRAILYLFFLISFIGMHWQLWAALALFMVPMIIGNFKSKFPNSTFLFQLLPVGIPAMIVMTFLNKWYQGWIGSMNLDPTEKTRMIFILFALPSFVISFAKMFGRTAKAGDVRWYLRDKNKVLYRTAGPLLAILAGLLTLGVI